MSRHAIDWFRPLLSSPSLWALLVLIVVHSLVRGDGKLFPPRAYKGSLEELAQEAIIIFRTSAKEGGSFEDLILKIDVKGQTDQFAWVIPFPKEPKVEKEDARIFKELHEYVEDRRVRGHRVWDKDKDKDGGKDKDGKPGLDERPVVVLSRQVVGSYDVAVVRETQAGALNQWLKTEGFQSLPENAEDVLGFYRKKGYVFACVKAHGATPGKDTLSVLHPLRFSFQTGGYDGIYFPMKLTGLQTEPFNVNLYIFHRGWINPRLSRYGYMHRGFSLRYCDWDSPGCQRNAGKDYSAPQHDPFLNDTFHLFPTVTKLFQKLHPGERYYLTNIQARGLKPAEVRSWPDDLWLFPYNVTPNWVPHDARPGGIASAGWPTASTRDESDDETTAFPRAGTLLAALALCLVAGSWLWWRRGAKSPS